MSHVRTSEHDPVQGTQHDTDRGTQHDTPEDTPVASPKPRARSRGRSDWAEAFAPRNLTATIVAGYLPILLALLIIVLPLLWMVISSFKPNPEIITLAPTFWPQNPTVGNYEYVADRVPLGRVLMNSVITTSVGAAVKVFLAITTAYALVFINVPFKNVIFLGILVALMVPPEVSMLPNYLTIAGLGGLNTLWGIILPGLGTAFGTFLLRQQFKTLPRELIEAAELDGAGHWKRLWRIVVPVSAPTIATVALVTIVGEWNDFLWPMLITDDPNVMTLPVGLNLLRSIEGATGTYGVLMAGAVLVIVPVLVIFAALQRYIVAGLTQGAVK
ncbi:glycerol-3-phosphate ABC transporter permease [Pseudoclavibacter endophyticus]|uniref:Carbohydrate ABC transporter permease n=1 Tax=Pseudoclavibacter endophyticus TaxID=1778590 RepID=A0A6H9WMB6_9MICO|nr:carbohydrate ABC transporter permease [Pseudoclavibacter endophyticus]KAB1650313.1 carbohydrate ABC transporter permease [Pseudoclavibacter endophyticus]GGA55223.1 glycerol-3-phosphate ABC transporter permease [Pseudoclavibacter endophyticus]